MSYSQAPVQYGLAAAQSDVPISLSSSGLPRPINSSVQIVSIASTSAAQQANGQVTFSIPTGASAGYLKNNSMYLKCKVAISTAANTAAATTFALKSSSASALINRLTVSCGKQLSQINNYHLLAEMLITHTTSRNFYSDDSSILQYTGRTAFAVNSVNGASIDVVIPIVCPLFNADKALPLFLLNSPILVQFDLNSVANAFKNAGGEILNYTISSAQLVYEVIQPDMNFVAMIKAGMLPSAENPAGNMYQLNIRDYMTLITASSATLNYQIGANLSSVNAVAYAQITNAPAQNADTRLVKNGQTNFRLALDGRLVNNFNLDNEPQIFAEMNRSFANLFDSNITSNCSATDYSTDNFVGAVSCRRVSDVMSMTGTACQNINLQLDSTGGNFNTYIVVLYDQVLTIDATGTPNLIH